MNIQNRTIFCKDNLEILRGINSETVDMIYLDPPFNKGRAFQTPLVSKYKVAGKEVTAQFADTWHDNEQFKSYWISEIKEQYPKLHKYLKTVAKFSNQSNRNYLTFMAMRLIEMKRVLKETGSIVYHCDHTMSHYIKLLMDIIFGIENFKNNIVWGYRTGGVSKKYLPRKHDDLFYYAKNHKKNKHYPIQERIFYDKPFFTDKQDEKGRWYADVYLRDVWDDPAVKPLINTSKERVGYPTQKPKTLLSRILEMATEEGDFVLDPFCGCATTCVAAHILKRQWVGIDVEAAAGTLVNLRLNEKGEGRDLLSQDYVHVAITSETPVRTDLDVIQTELQTADERRRRSLTKEAREAVWERDEGKCVECGSKENLHYDHIIPFSKGGANTADNLQLLCAPCNLSKGNRAHA